MSKRTDDQSPDEVEAPAETVEEPTADADALPTHKDDLAALAIERGIPSYEAWSLTVPELTKRLES